MRTTAEQNEKSVTTDIETSVLNTPLASAAHDVEHVERYINADIAALSRREQCWTFVPKDGEEDRQESGEEKITCVTSVVLGLFHSAVIRLSP